MKKIILRLCWISLMLIGCTGGRDLPPAEKLALFQSVESGDVSKLKSALNRGVSPNLYHPGKGYIIFDATAFGNKAALEILIAAGANVNAKNKEGDGPLMVAILGWRCEEARILLQAGANPNEVFSDSAAAEAAAASFYNNKTARDLYYMGKQRSSANGETLTDCWSKVERLLAESDR